MPRIDYERLRQLDTVPLLEFEESLNEKIKREVEAKKREARDEAKKSKRKRNRDRDRD